MTTGIKGHLCLAGMFIVLSLILTLSLTAVMYTQGILNHLQETNQKLEQQVTDIEIALSQLNTAQNMVELYADISPAYEWREQELLGSVRLAEERLWAARQIIWKERGYTLKGQ